MYFPMSMLNAYIPKCSDLPKRLIKALKGEQDAMAYYTKLVNMAKSKQDKDIISEFINDETKHFKNFRKFYIQLTGREPMLPPPTEPNIPNYIEGIKASIIDETDAYEFYKDTYFCTYDPIAKEIFFEAFTDEIQHAVKLNYLYTKNK